MAPGKQERLVNLTICLLVTPRFITKAEIRDSVTAYRDMTQENFDRTFERDKAELRERGIPVETGTNDTLFGDEPGYRIPRAEFEMPQIDLTPDEATAVALASHLWQEHTMATPTRRALAKLRSMGAVPLAGRTDLVPLPEGHLEAGALGESFATIVDAITTRTHIRFDYHDTTRDLQPWIISLRNNAWYVTGLDTAKDERRTFRLNRIQNAPILVGKPAAFDIPEDVHAGDVVASLAPQGQQREAVIAIRDVEAPSLRRRGTPRDDVAPWPDYRLYDVIYDSVHDIVGDLAAAGESAIVIEPASLRDAVIAHLETIAAEGPAHA